MIQRLYKKISKLRGDNSWKYYEELKKIKFDTQENIQKRQIKKLQKLINHAWSFKIYKKLWQIKPKINSIKDIEKLPAITKKDFKGYNFKGKKDSTSGSTGEPFEFWLSKDAYEKKKARGFLSYKLCGVEFGEKICILWGFNHDNFKGKIYKKFIQNVLPLSAFDMDDTKMKEYIRKINNFKPKMIQSYTSAIYALAQFMKRENLKLNFKLKAIITSGETLTIVQRKLIEEIFGCKVINRYGSREFGMIAQECKKGKMHVVEDLLVETEKGEILVTDLNNFAMPFVRYKIGDSGILSKEKCSCGINLPVLKEIKGRVSEFITSPSGKILSLHFLTLFFQDYAEKVKQFQVKQIAKDKINLLIVPVKQDEKLKKELKEKFSKEIDMKINVKFVDEVELTKAGKRRLIIR